MRGEHKIRRKRVQNAQGACIFTLPTEILLLIFHDLCAEGTPRAVLRRRYPRELLAHVCLFFRQIILQTPDFWTTVDFPLYWTPDQLCSYVPCMLERARNTPLRIVVRDGMAPTINPELVDVFTRLFSCVKRIESIHFFAYHDYMNHFRQGFIAALPCPPNSFVVHRIAEAERCSILFARTSQTPLRPMDRANQFYISTHANLAAVESVKVVDSIVRLEEDSLRDAVMSWRSFELTAHPLCAYARAGAEADLVLQRCPQLETLVVDGILLFDALHRQPLKPSLLPPLRELLLPGCAGFYDLERLLPGVVFPHLVKFGVGDESGQGLPAFLLRHPNITDLTLGIISDYEGIAAACPQVTKLSLKVLALHLVFAQPPEDNAEGSRRTPPFPNLERLHIETDDYGLFARDFERIIKSRIVNRKADDVHKTKLTTLSVRIADRRWLFNHHMRFAVVWWEDDVCFMDWAEDVPLLDVSCTSYTLFPVSLIPAGLI